MFSKDRQEIAERDLERNKPSMTEILRNVDRVEAVATALPEARLRHATTPAEVAAISKSAIFKAAWWMRSLRYEDKMKMAQGMFNILSRDTENQQPLLIDSPEKLAALLSKWDQEATEAEGGFNFAG